MDNQRGSSCVKSCAAAFAIKYRPSEEVLAEYGKWEAPDDVDAREHYVSEHGHHDMHSLGCPLKDLREFGEGVLLYFHMLKHTALLFGVLAACPGVVLMVLCGMGGWYENADIERTTLGNYGLLSQSGGSTSVDTAWADALTANTTATTEGGVTLLFMSSTTAPGAALGGGGPNKRSTLVAMSILDLVGVLVFFGYCSYMRWFVRKAADAADANTVTVKDYAVRVGGLPPDASGRALREYLTRAAAEGAEEQEEPGEVVQVELCRRVAVLLRLVVRRGEVLEGTEAATAVLQRTAMTYPKTPLYLEVGVLDGRVRLGALNAAIHAEQAAADRNQVVSAFVTFSTADARRRALAALPRSLLRQWRMPPDKRFNNGGIGRCGVRPVALSLSPAPEPSDVMYEHLEYGAWQRLARRVATHSAKYLVLVAGFVLVGLAPALRLGLSTTGTEPTREECAAACDYVDAAGNYALTDANRSIYAECDPVSGTGVLPNRLDCEDTSRCYECFCRAALNAAQYGEVWYCRRFGDLVAINVVSQGLAVLGILLVNLLITAAIGWLTQQEKHHTRSAEAVSHARGLFLLQFVSTAFSNLVANMYLPGLAQVVSGSFLEGVVFTGVYSDTTPRWYRDVGRPIVISMFLNTLLLHAQVGLQWWRRRHALAHRYRCLTQGQLQEAFGGHRFELATKYGQHLYVIFVVMTYSGGMPILYLVAAFHFATSFWVEKFELLRVCKRPLTYSRALPEYAASSLPFAALWHLAFAVWTYSLFGMGRSILITEGFYQGLADTLQSFKALIPSGSTLTPATVAARLTQASSGHLLVAFMACAGALALTLTLSSWVWVIRQAATALGLTRDGGARGNARSASMAAAAAAAEGCDVPEFGVAVRSQMLVGPTSYCMRTNPAYAHAFVRMEEFDWDEKELEARVQAMVADIPPGAVLPGPAAALVRALSARQRHRTAADRLRARQKAAAIAGANQVYPEPAAASQLFPLAIPPGGQEGAMGMEDKAGAYPVYNVGGGGRTRRGGGGGGGTKEPAMLQPAVSFK